MPTQSKTLIKSRSTAFERQGGRCYYCDFPMWRGSIEHFARLYGITLGQARQFQCTAEHLLARQDGGGWAEQYCCGLSCVQSATAQAQDGPGTGSIQETSAATIEQRAVALASFAQGQCMFSRRG